MLPRAGRRRRRMQRVVNITLGHSFPRRFLAEHSPTAAASPTDTAEIAKRPSNWELALSLHNSWARSSPLASARISREKRGKISAATDGTPDALRRVVSLGALRALRASPSSQLILHLR